MRDADEHVLIPTLKRQLVDLPIDELALQGGNEDVLVSVAHGQILPSPRGAATVSARLPGLSTEADQASRA